MSEDKNNDINVEKERILGGAGWKWKLKCTHKSVSDKELSHNRMGAGGRFWRLGKTGILKVKSRESYESW